MVKKKKQLQKRKKYPRKLVISKISDSGGIVTEICKRLGCSRQTFYDYLRDDEKIKKAYDEERDSVGDVAESNIVEALYNGDIETSKWYLERRHQDRGYGSKQQIQQETSTTRVVFVSPEKYGSPEEWAQAQKK